MPPIPLTKELTEQIKAFTIKRLENHSQNSRTAEFLRPRSSARIEHRIPDPCVGGSNPLGGTRLLSRGDVMHDVVILGAGPAGLTAAIYAARANHAPVVITGPLFGGQLALTTEVENFPGFPDGVLGPELMELMKRQAERFGAEIRIGDVTDVELTQSPLRMTFNGELIETKSLIIATGASARLLGVPGQSEFF